MTNVICELIRLMAYRHSLNKKKNNTKTATPAPRPKTDRVAKSYRLATALQGGSLVELPPEFSLFTIQWLNSDCESVYAWMVLLALKAM